MIKIQRAGLLLLAVMVLQACKPELDPPAFDAGRANFDRVVSLGGSIMAGSQDGALYREGQENSLPELIVRQIRAAGATVEFASPLLPAGSASIGTNPKPWESLLQTRSQLGDRTDCEDVVSLGPVKDTLSIADAIAAGLTTMVSDVSYNLALPGAGMDEINSTDLALSPSLAGPASFWRRIQGNNGSPLARAIELNPSFVVFWPGMQDVFNWASTGGALSELVSPADFRLQLDSMLGALTVNGSKGVLATIPDIGDIPFFTTIPARGLELSQALADSLNEIYDLVGASVDFVAGENGFVVGDPDAPRGFRQLEAGEFITLTVPLDSMRCSFMGVLVKLMPDRYTLIGSELLELRTAVVQYNAIIVELAAKYDFALADAQNFYARLDAGIVEDAVTFDTEFVSGGYFSLDGYTPHPKGCGMLANVFIEAINIHFDANVPPVRLDNLRGVLFP
jgi:hypothetical protein